MVLLDFSSFLHWAPRGSVVTLLISSRVMVMDNPLTTVVELVLP